LCGCGSDTVDYELINILEKIREYYKHPIRINSAYRCLDHNKYIGSTDTSQHPKGKAADIVVSGLSTIAVYHFLDHEYPNKYGIGVYNDFIHIDVREKKARWDKRS
jgi:uncharacterized protein YcbK (DUF882 family)